jgi:hypothetical protein
MTTTQQAFDAMREALELCYEHCRVYHPEVETNNVGKTVNAALAAAKAVEPQVKLIPTAQELGTPQPRQWQELTEGETWALWNAQGSDEMNQQECTVFAQVISRALKAKNAQPDRQPLTPDGVKAICSEAGYNVASAQEKADFINGLRHGERAHCITPKSGTNTAAPASGITPENGGQ